MNPEIDPTVAVIERAAFTLRRLWAKPELMRHVREMCGEPARPIQRSNLMVIHAVAHLGEERAGDVTVSAVAERLDIDPSTASRLVGHAIDAGYLSRRPSPVDARRASLRLTDAGLRVKKATDQYRRQFIARLVADWSAEERELFARLLSRFAAAATVSPFDPAGADRVFEAARPPGD